MDKRNSFTDAEIERIQAAFWGRYADRDEGDVPCPRCSGTVHVEIPPVWGVPPSVSATCDGCRTSSSFKAAPKPGPAFTEDQTRTFVDSHRRGRRPSCPVDGTSLKVVETQGFNGSAYDVACPRCGASGELKVNP